MKTITRTVYGAYLQTCMLLNLPFSMASNSTLNEKFGVESGTAPTSDVLPKVGYFAIGNGGHSFSVGINNITKNEVVQHRARDAALFNHLPFVLREPADDLTAAERAKYGLRREETYNGVRYIAYYLKRMELSDVVAEMQYKVVEDDETETTTPFTPTSADLSPTPQVLSSTGVNTTTGDYLTATAKVLIDFTSDDVVELQNVANVIYGDPDYAMVSEIALVSGVDKVVSVTNTGIGTFNFKEVIAAQVCSFVAALYSASMNNEGFEIVLDVGATEPLFKLK